jgi:hypothetical protein
VGIDKEVSSRRRTLRSSSHRSSSWRERERESEREQISSHLSVRVPGNSGTRVGLEWRYIYGDREKTHLLVVLDRLLGLLLLLRMSLSLSLWLCVSVYVPSRSIQDECKKCKEHTSSIMVAKFCLRHHVETPC